VKSDTDNENDESDIKNDEIEKHGDVEMSNGRRRRRISTIYIVFGALICVGIVSLILGTIFRVEDIGFYILRFFLIIIGMLFCYLGANRAVTYRRPNRVIPGLILFGIGMILIFIGILMFFRFELFSLA